MTRYMHYTKTLSNIEDYFTCYNSNFYDYIHYFILS